jgi:hypothetical protein
LDEVYLNTNYVHSQPEHESDQPRKKLKVMLPEFGPSVVLDPLTFSSHFGTTIELPSPLSPFQASPQVRL